MKLLERSRDKEALVRVQASIALCRLQVGSFTFDTLIFILN